jgi:alpha-glucosidase
MENQQAEGSDRMPDVINRYYPDQIKTLVQEGNHFEFTCENGVALHLTALTPTMFRLRYALESEFMSDFSYAIDDKFQPEIPELYFQEFEEYYAIATFEMTCQIMKEGLLVNFFDKNGNVICEDEDGFYLRESLLEGVSHIKLTKKAPKGKMFFGLGDKASSLNLRGKAYENWCTDAFGFTDETDHLYRAIPFYQALHEGLGYGIFLDNSYKTRFSFDRKGNKVSSFSANGGEMNYYFIFGPELTSVTKQYLNLTGKPELPPLWSLGFHQCKWSYYPDDKVRKVAKEFREREIPCDAIYLDIDYMDEFRCFTWNKEFFPNPAELIQDLKKDGFESVVMIDPGIKVDKDYWVHQEGIKGGHFCRRADGMLMKGPVWPSECHFPDFTNPTTREWWGTLYKELLEEVGVSGFWNDMNEPAIFKINYKTFPDSVRHNYDGHNCSHKKAHNIYGMQMSRASFNGIKAIRPQKRPFLLTRASYSGGQRYAALWTGDNLATWEHLHIANIQSQRMSISGFSFVGSDIGGFAENPTGELFVRWLQLGIFHPLMRVHSMGNHLDGGAPIDPIEVAKMELSGLVQDQEPWSFGDEFTPLAKKAIELRYQLLPYLYTAFRKYVEDGEPVLKPLSFYDQNDTFAAEFEEAFIFGNQILVCPVSSPDTRAKQVYLPKNNWYEFWTNEFYEGQQEVNVAAPLDKIPFFVEAGTILPIAPVMQYTNERPIDIMTLNVYYKKGVTDSELYQDAGDGYAYELGNYSLHLLELNASDETATINQNKAGNLIPTYQFKLNFIGFPFEITTCEVDETSIAVTENSCIVSSDFKTLVVK